MLNVTTFFLLVDRFGFSNELLHFLYEFLSWKAFLTCRLSSVKKIYNNDFDLLFMQKKRLAIQQVHNVSNAELFHFAAINVVTKIVETVVLSHESID